jgi:hypothetical protein
MPDVSVTADHEMDEPVWFVNPPSASTVPAASGTLLTRVGAPGFVVSTVQLTVAAVPVLPALSTERTFKL